MTSGNKTVNSKKKCNILQILGGVACALFCVAWLGGCVLFGASMCSFHEEKNPDSDEYVGVWAAYMVKVDDKSFMRTASMKSMTILFCMKTVALKR